MGPHLRTLGIASALVLLLSTPGFAEDLTRADHKELDAAHTAAEAVLDVLRRHGVSQAADVESLSHLTLQDAFADSAEIAQTWMSRWRAARRRLTSPAATAGNALYKAWRSPANRGPTLEILTRKKGVDASLGEWRNAVIEIHAAARTATRKLTDLLEDAGPAPVPLPRAPQATPPVLAPADEDTTERATPAIRGEGLQSNPRNLRWVATGHLAVTLRVPAGQRADLGREAPLVLQRAFGSHVPVEVVTLSVDLLFQNRFGERAWKTVRTLRMEKPLFDRIVWKNLTREDIDGLLTWTPSHHPGWRLVDEVGAQATADETPKGSEGAAPERLPAKPLAFAHRVRQIGGMPAPLRRIGGSSRRVVEGALDWLAAHVSPSGLWETTAFHRWCQGEPVPREDRTDGLGKPEYDVGVTGIAVQAFLAAGITHRSAHRHHAVVQGALDALIGMQDAEGAFGSRRSASWIYNHAMATLAVLDAYALTGDPLLRSAAQRGVALIHLARNPYFAWRYGLKPGDNDTSITGWMGTALWIAARIDAGERAQGRPSVFPVPDEEPDAWEDGILAWLTKMEDAASGRVGYITRGSLAARPKDLVDRFPGERSQSMTAVAAWLWGRLRDDVPSRSVSLLLKTPPSWTPSDGSIDLYYWVWGAHALACPDAVPRTMQPAARTWRRRLGEALARGQVTRGALEGAKGSIAPLGPWGPDGGRVYSTAMGALALLAEHRFDDR